MNWRDAPFLVFDLETTGVNVFEDRIVTSCVALIPAAPAEGGQRLPKVFSRIVDPRVEVPEEASAIHGLTTEYVRKHGIDPPTALEEAAGLLRWAVDQRVPIVTMNGAFDFTVLDRECERWGVRPVADHPSKLGPVIDIRVIDKQADPYRKKEPDGTSTRTLTGLCKLWHIPLEGAHDSTVDALATGKVAWKMARGPIPRVPSRRPYDTPQLDIGAMKPEDLHAAQVEWYATQSRNMATFFRGLASQQVDPDEAAALRAKADSIRPDGWPYVPRDEPDPAFQGSLFDQP